MEEEGVSNSVNLRDIGENAGGIAKNRVFRSSQFYSLPLQQKHVREVSTVLDLRREGSPCKRSRLLLKFIVLWKSWPELFTEGKTNSHSPSSCAKCESRLKGEYKEVARTQVFSFCLFFATQSVLLITNKAVLAQVFHLDLVTLGFKRRVFQAVPLEVKLKAICRLATFRSPEPVLAEKVADPDALGYKKLYVLFLEQSKRKIAAVFTVLEHAESYPVLIHCVHGCESRIFPVGNWQLKRNPRVPSSIYMSVIYSSARM